MQNPSKNQKKQKSNQVRSHYNNLIQQLYKEEPVDIMTFISSPRYLGASTDDGKGVYPFWKKALIEMFDDNSKIIIVMTGSIAAGKTSISMYALCYIQYRLMLLKDPWGFFKLNPSGKMTICFFNLNRTLGDSIGFSRMMSYMSNSPWFRENATSIRTTKKGDVLDFSLIDYALASPWSRGFGITGREVVSAILDEVDSPMDPESQKERVVETYSAMFTRFQTRFAPNDYSIGKVFVVCSRQEENSFINTFIAQRQHSGKNDTLIYDPSVWEAKPVGTYSEIKFPVFTGNQYTPPKIIQESEVKQYIDGGHDLIYVPIDFKENFQTNIIRAMRDIAGRSVAGTHKYGLFPSESLISDCFDLTKIDPIPKQTIFTGQKDQLDLIHYINISDIRLPKSTPRYLHYDISFTGDASAVSMCGVKDWKYVDIANPDGTFRQELSPIIETDFCMRIKALDGDRIPPAKVRKLVLDLRQMGFNIAQFSADLQMASEDTLQILRSAGFKAEYISVDKSNKAYFDFRNLVCEKRWVCHNHQMLFFELKNLEVSPLTGKVDHPKKVQDVEFMDTGEANETVAEGSKDLSDSISASITQCLYANERPMDTQLMTNLLKRGSLAPNINNGTLQQEDINKILPLTTSDGSIITGTVDRSGQVDKIQDIFRRMHSR